MCLCTKNLCGLDNKPQTRVIGPVYNGNSRIEGNTFVFDFSRQPTRIDWRSYTNLRRTTLHFADDTISTSVPTFADQRSASNPSVTLERVPLETVLVQQFRRLPFGLSIPRTPQVVEFTPEEILSDPRAEIRTVSSDESDSE